MNSALNAATGGPLELGGGASGDAAGAGVAAARAGDDDAGAQAVYRQAVLDKLAAHKHYPRAARRLRVEGTVTLALSIAPDGTLSRVPTVVTGAHALLDTEALQLVRRALPFAATGRLTPVELIVPIRFALR